ncbi:MULTISPECIES: alpha/beta hydrolase family esterase [unclassified Nocardioides]|uniref:alpha/beta hydrolase family esterase n=1 Tax=unclassified Nocardioides TaxID=2615069 RepID=UPI000700681C|nr:MULTISPECIES: PHB depolymerase family esterase [unclassified Nocardioides]KQY57340.1 poly(3-hydroxybutyrate) depolymerase [Nocardioides sp. Root140]KRF20467.1 poly(3-hydroxybutyrate) depolymerase [Nocardioides sp. Soil796]
MRVRRHLLRATALAVLPLAALATSPAQTTAQSAASSDSAASSAACALEAPQPDGTDARYDLTLGGRERSFVLHLPAGYSMREDWPLIVAYHGRGSTAVELQGYSKLSTLPAVTVFPEGEIGTGSGYRQAWQGAPYAPPGVDDVAFTADLLDHLDSTLCVDESRTYATGKSNGAGFVALLACRMPDRFAAFAPVAGAFYPGSREGCDTAAPTSVMEVHGSGDATIPYAGDADRDLPAIRDWVDEWVVRDQCRPDPRTAKRGDDVTLLSWGGCTDGTSVEHVVVEDGGHVWPGADVYSGGGYVTHTVEAHRLIWKFFSQHSLEEADR